MAYQVYEPGATATTFSLFARQFHTREEKRKEEEKEKDKKLAIGAQISFGGYKAAEAKSIEDKTQALRLYSTLDPRTAT